MSWSKIGLFDKPNAPIPMYGGVKVPLSDRCCVSSANSNSEKPLVFAVVANPYILQQSGKYADNLKVSLHFLPLVLAVVASVKDCLEGEGRGEGGITYLWGVNLWRIWGGMEQPPKER